jgi:Tfp pilus assembly protein PilN
MSEEKKKTGLNKEISFKKTSKWPEKKSINFISDEQSKNNKKAIVLFCIFLLLLVPFTYFGVIKQIAKVNTAQAQYNQVQEQIAALNAQTADYNDVKTKYDAAVGSFLTDDEKVCTDRMKIFKMIEEDIIPSASIQSIAITGSQVTVQTGTTNLAAVSSMIVTLQSDKRNQYVTVTTTSDATSSSTDAVIATFEITYAVGGTN